MRFLRPGEPIADPFFAAVRRRHRDIDIVMLPPEPPPADLEHVGDDVVNAALIRVATQAKHLWAAIAPNAEEEPHSRLDYGIDPASVRARARVTTTRADGFEVLVRLRHELESHGWEVRRPTGQVERLSAVFEDLDLAASYAGAPGTPGALLFSLSSASLPVGTDRARELTRITRDRGDR